MALASCRRECRLRLGQHREQTQQAVPALPEIIPTVPPKRELLFILAVPPLGSRVNGHYGLLAMLQIDRKLLR